MTSDRRLKISRPDGTCSIKIHSPVPAGGPEHLRVDRRAAQPLSGCASLTERLVLSVRILSCGLGARDLRRPHRANMEIYVPVPAGGPEHLRVDRRAPCPGVAHQEGRPPAYRRCRVQGAGCRVQGFGLRVWGVGRRVWGVRCGSRAKRAARPPAYRRFISQHVSIDQSQKVNSPPNRQLIVYCY